MAMSGKVKEKWSASLRSGKYLQGNGALRRGNRYCHIGVLCDVMRETGCGDWGNTGENGNDLFTTRRWSSWRELPIDLARGLNVAVDPKAIAPDGRVILLSRLNDCGVSFDELARIIEGCDVV